LKARKLKIAIAASANKANFTINFLHSEDLAPELQCVSRRVGANTKDPDLIRDVREH